MMTFAEYWDKKWADVPDAPDRTLAEEVWDDSRQALLGPFAEFPRSTYNLLPTLIQFDRRTHHFAIERETEIGGTLAIRSNEMPQWLMDLTQGAQ